MLNLKSIKKIRKVTSIETPQKDKLILFTENKSGILGDDYYKISYEDFAAYIASNIPTPTPTPTPTSTPLPTPNLNAVLGAGNSTAISAIFTNGALNTLIDPTGINVTDGVGNSTIGAGVFTLSGTLGNNIILRDTQVGDNGTYDVFFRRQSGTVALLDDIISVNLYNSDGNLQGHRTIEQDNKSITFQSTSPGANFNISYVDAILAESSSIFTRSAYGTEMNAIRLVDNTGSSFFLNSYFLQLGRNTGAGTFQLLKFNENGIFIEDTYAETGLIGAAYYGANYTDNTYIQKKYVDDSIASIVFPSSVNIFNSNGTLTSNRTVTLDNKQLNFYSVNNGNFNIAVGNPGNNSNSEFHISPNGYSMFASNTLLNQQSNITLLKPLLTIGWYDYNNNNGNSLQFGTTGILLEDSLFNKGIVGNAYYGANYDATTYIQKKYVDDLLSEVEQTHTSGPNVIIANGTTILYVDPTSTIASLTIIMPPNPVNGQEVKISFGGTINMGTVCTSLAVVGNVGQSVLGGVNITKGVVGDGITLKYQASTNLWRLFYVA